MDSSSKIDLTHLHDILDLYDFIILWSTIDNILKNIFAHAIKDKTLAFVWGKTTVSSQLVTYWGLYHIENCFLTLKVPL